jgi:hypothetical protein
VEVTAMRYVIGALTMLALVLAAGAPAGAQTGERVLDTLNDLLRGGSQQLLQGHVVAVHDEDVVVRGKDNRTYTVATTGIDRRVLGDFLVPGQPIKVKVRRGDNQTLTAISMEPDTGLRKSFRTVTGVVEPLPGDRIQFRTSEGFVVPVDLGQVVGRKPMLRPGEAATMTYEMSGANPIVALWVEPRDTSGAAASPRTEPGGARGSGYERIHGFVESISIGSLTLKTDDGRRLMVDIGKSRGGGDVRPGDLVSVVGRPTGDRFAAELVQKD